MPIILFQILIWSVVLISPITALAGSFRAVPIKIYFDNKTKSSAIEVINDGQEILTLQLDLSKWDQDKEGNDIYEPTKDLIFFPKILNLNAGEKKVIRLGYEGKKDFTEERTYRLFLEELPISKPGEIELKLAIKMGLPVFIKPAKPIHNTTIDSAELAGGILNIRLKNSGNNHFIANRITAKGFGKTGEETFSEEITGWYVLAERTYTYHIEILNRDCRLTDKIHIEVAGDSSLLKDILQVNENMCQD